MTIIVDKDTAIKAVCMMLNLSYTSVANTNGNRKILPDQTEIVFDFDKDGEVSSK